jgi:DnaJ-class molecular chaperone
VTRPRLLLLALSTALLVLLAACSETCPSCHGEGVVRTSGPCAACGGTGSVQVTCEACRGHGRLGAGNPCPRCQGKGLVACDYTSFVDVEVPSGDSATSECPKYEKVRVVCREGRLWPAQPLPDGTGSDLFRDNPGRKCPACGGEGTATCPLCGGAGIDPGTGVCTACGGTGQVHGTCPRCAGKGVAEQTSPCPRCAGKGRVSRWSP